MTTPGEPPAKITKIMLEDMEHFEEEDDEMGEGQEEWLSEGVLTDDDFNPGTEQETLDPNLTATTTDSHRNSITPDLDDPELAQQMAALEQKTSETDKVENSKNDAPTNPIPVSAPSEFQKLVDQTLESEGHHQAESDSHHEPQSDGHHQPEPDGHRQSEAKNDIQSIEAELSSFDVLDGHLSSYFAKKNDQKPVGTEVKNEIVNKQENDGNDTDELLRLLGDDDTRVKKKVLVKKTTKQDPTERDSSDDEFSYQNTASVKTLKVARNVLMKGRPASKALPEDMSDGENYTASSDEVSTVQKMFGVKQPKKNLTNIKKDADKCVIKRVVRVKSPVNIGFQDSTPKQFANKNSRPKSILRSVRLSKPEIKVTSKPKTEIGKTESKPDIVKIVDKKDFKVQGSKPGQMELGDDEMLDEDGFLEDEDDFQLDEEEFGEESDPETNPRKQHIMRPERMDEEVPSDVESHTEDGSLYDEMPSSDSEDLDDWFTVDIRDERAGDYLPLLGPKARELLLEEKKRMITRLSALRQSLSSLTESGRKQAEQLRHDTIALAELDDMLKAT